MLEKHIIIFIFSFSCLRQFILFFCLTNLFFYFLFFIFHLSFLYIVPNASSTSLSSVLNPFFHKSTFILSSLNSLSSLNFPFFVFIINIHIKILFFIFPALSLTF